MTPSVDLRWRHMRRYLIVMAAAVALTACSSPPPAAKPTEAAKPAEAAKPVASAQPAASPAAADAAKPVAEAKPAAEVAKPSVNFAGKNVRLIVGYAPGGGFDSTARILSPYLQEALPGNPTIIVENQPGADSLVAAKSNLSGSVRPDEITIVVVIATQFTKSVLGGGVDGFAIEKEAAIMGKPDAGTTILALCAQSKVVKSYDEFMSMSRPLKVAATTGGSLYDVLLKWTKESGFNIDLVSGYPGTAQMILAFNQGEVDATASCRDVDLAGNPDWLGQDQITPLMYWSDPPQTLKKLQQEQGKFPWFKQALELKQVTPDQKDVLLNVNDTNHGTNVYVMNKQTPAATLDAVRVAMKQAVSNPAFIADMDKRQLPVGYMSPEDVLTSVTAVEKFSPEAREMMKRLLAV